MSDENDDLLKNILSTAATRRANQEIQQKQQQEFEAGQRKRREEAKGKIEIFMKRVGEVVSRVDKEVDPAGMAINYTVDQDNYDRQITLHFHVSSKEVRGNAAKIDISINDMGYVVGAREISEVYAGRNASVDELTDDQLRGALLKRVAALVGVRQARR